MKKARNQERSLGEHMEAGADWETDEIATLKSEKRRAVLFGIAGWTLAGLAIFGAASLFPLKSVEPFVVQVDKIGEASTVTLLRERTVSDSEALDKYWLSMYVNYREEYSKAASYGNYKAVEYLSNDEVFGPYFNAIRPDNDKSPTALFGEKGVIEVDVNNITFIGTRHAQVRFTRKSRQDSGMTPSTSEWIATITYEYVNPPMDERARLINPVGFRVTGFRTDPVAGAPTGGK